MDDSISAAPELPWCNLLDVLKAEDPYAAIDELRTEAPVWRSDFGVHVTTYEDCLELLRDRRFTQDVDTMLSAAGITDGVVRNQWTTSLLGSARADHDRMRRLVSPSFTPKAIASVRDLVTDLAGVAGDAAAERGSLEVMSELANGIPPAVFCRMISAPGDDAPFIGRVSAQILEIFARRPELGPSIESASYELIDYVDGFIDTRRRSPIDGDLISNLLAAEEAGERLVGNELRALVIEVLEASTDNTSSQLALVLYAAAQNPDVWADLRADPSLIPEFVEEASRLWPRITGIAKVTEDEEPAEIFGLTVEPGTPVFAMVPSAHRDPAVHEMPLTFDAARESKTLNLNYGAGAHFCIGASLARLEICGAVEALTRRWGSVAVAEEPDLDFNPGVVTVRSLNLEVEAA